MVTTDFLEPQIRNDIMAFIKEAAGSYVGNRVYLTGTRGSGSIPASPEKPFIQFSFGGERLPTFRSVGGFTIQELFVDFIEDPGSMHRVDFVLNKIKAHLISKSASMWPSGQFVYEVKWMGRSGDLPKEDDAAFRRYDTFWITKGSDS